MKIQEIKDELNREFMIAFMKRVCKEMRRENMSAVVINGHNRRDGATEYNRLTFRLTYVGFVFSVLMDEAGTVFNLLAGKEHIGQFDDISKLKAAVVKYVREDRAAKIQQRKNRREPDVS